MKVMLDLNILLDHIQKREPHYQFSSIVISEVLKNKVEGIIPAHALTTLYYLISKYTNKERANERIDWLLEKFDFVGGDKSLFKRARNLQIEDFEDAVVASLAEDLHCDHIISRNVPDFENFPIPAITPEEFARTYVNVE